MNSPRENYTSSVKNVSKNSSTMKMDIDRQNASQTAEFRLLTFFPLQAGKCLVK